MQTKICSKCGQEKPIDEFRKDKAGKYGVRGDCRVCENEYRKNNIEKMREFGRASHARNREKRLAHKKEYFAANIDNERKRIREYAKRRPDQKKAKDAVATAVRRGDMLPVTDRLCTVCSNSAQEYHHPSYDKDKWLIVIPLCKSCHRRIHRGTLTTPPIVPSR